MNLIIDYSPTLVGPSFKLKNFNFNNPVNKSISIAKLTSNGLKVSRLVVGIQQSIQVSNHFSIEIQSKSGWKDLYTCN